MQYEMVIPVEVKPKQRPRFNFKTGHAYTPKETKDCEMVIGQYMKAQSFNVGIIPKGTSIRLSFDIQITNKRSTKSDIDNYLKTVMDSGNGILWDDDSQITSIAGTLTRGASEAKVCLEVETL